MIAGVCAMLVCSISAARARWVDGGTTKLSAARASATKEKRRAFDGVAGMMVPPGSQRRLARTANFPRNVSGGARIARPAYRMAFGRAGTDNVETCEKRYRNCALRRIRQREDHMSNRIGAKDLLMVGSIPFETN